MNILTKKQKEAIDFFAKSKLAEKFYWTGGTLLAYHYFNHRRSEDLDFFTNEEFSYEEVNKWAKMFQEAAKFTKYTYKKVFDRWEYLFENKEILRIEFVYYNSDRKTLVKREKVQGIYIDSLEDIGANKLVATVERNEPKDLFDMFFIIKKGKISPQKIIKLANEKFGTRFGEDLFWGEALKTAPYLEKLQPFLLGSKERNTKLLIEVENYFKEGSRKFLKKFIT